jgi:putative addiction module CopG family antidote
MEPMTIVLPESMQQFVHQRVADGRFNSPTDYVCELIRADQKRMVEDRIDAALVGGLDSAEPYFVAEEHWEEKKRRLTEHFEEVLSEQS